MLEEVAREAGYTRGALYHQFKDKEDLALAVIEWVNENWMREVGEPAAQQADPVAELLALARGHAVFCRRDIARVVMALRLEFAGQDHPVGRETERIWETGVKRCVRLINAGRKAGSIPPGPPARAVALALLGALEGAVIALAGHPPDDEPGRPRRCGGAGDRRRSAYRSYLCVAALIRSVMLAPPSCPSSPTTTSSPSLVQTCASCHAMSSGELKSRRAVDQRSRDAEQPLGVATASLSSSSHAAWRQ